MGLPMGWAATGSARRTSRLGSKVLAGTELGFGRTVPEWASPWL